MYGLYCGYKIGHNGHGYTVEGSNLEFDTVDAAIAFIDGE